MKRALAIAIAACLLTAPASSAAGHAVTLSDPVETSCGGGACTPDLFSLAIYYDSDGTFFVSATFSAPLPAYTAPGALRVRVSLGHGLTADGTACAPSGSSAQLAGEPGDVRIEAGAYNGGSSPSPVANGVLFRVGSGSIATTRSISPDLKTLTLTATDAALAGLDLRCVQADLADDDSATATIRDQVQLAWFPGFGPSAPTATDTTSPAATTPDAPAGTGPEAARPLLVKRPAVRGARKVAARLTCGTGRWKGAKRFTYRWLRDGRLIARASARTYRVAPVDSGHSLRCRVQAINPAGSKLSRSGALRIP